MSKRSLFFCAMTVGSMAFLLGGCASTNPDGVSKVEKKISQAIGVEVGDFKLTSRVEGDSAPVGFSEGIYTVNTQGGKTYKCRVYEPSGVMNVLSWGGAGSAGAMCTDFTKNVPHKNNKGAPGCNDLLRAAGKC